MSCDYCLKPATEFFAVHLHSPVYEPRDVCKRHGMRLYEFYAKVSVQQFDSREARDEFLVERLL